MFPLDLALDDEPASLDELLGIVPSAARVRSADGDLNSTDNVAGKEATDAPWT